jgi:hypothetical protein
MTIKEFTLNRRKFLYLLGSSAVAFVATQSISALPICNSKKELIFLQYLRNRYDCQNTCYILDLEHRDNRSSILNQLEIGDYADITEWEAQEIGLLFHSGRYKRINGKEPLQAL